LLAVVVVRSLCPLSRSKGSANQTSVVENLRIVLKVLHAEGVKKWYSRRQGVKSRRDDDSTFCARQRSEVVW
jgi:hypothetical protein